MINKCGEKVWINCRGKVIHDNTSNQRLMVGRVSENALIQKADQLTGLLKISQMKQVFSQFAAENPQFFFVIVGLDNIKNLNEKYGRTFGNKILKALAGLIEKNAPDKNQIYRLCDDKFGLYFPAANKNELSSFYETLRWDFSHYCHSISENLFCTLSVGVSEYSNHSLEYNELFKYAESALNHAKASGKNTMVFFDWEIYENRLFQMAIQEELQLCIRDNFNNFSISYQPQFDIRTHKLIGAEALLRWVSPKYGEISPSEFIPILEKNNLISKVGLWIIEEALKQCKEWRKYIPDFRISVNLSYLQLKDHSVSQHVFNCLDEYALPGEALLLELTESAQLENYRFFNQLFYSLRQRGVYIAIDDFGTGYSSLKYLKDLHIDQIKIDRSSLLVTPFYSDKDKRVSGFIGVDNPTWFTKDATLLDSLSYFIVNEIGKRKLSEQLFFMSYRDALTGVYNRNCYKKDLEELSSDSNISIGIVYADINGLKKVNDELGHNAGDKLIKNVVSCLVTCFHEHKIYRVGGDEFIIICQDISYEDFQFCIRKVHAYVETHEDCSVALGHFWSDQQYSVEKLVKEADSLMYQDKNKYYQRYC